MMQYDIPGGGRVKASRKALVLGLYDPLPRGGNARVDRRRWRAARILVGIAEAGAFVLPTAIADAWAAIRAAMEDLAAARRPVPKPTLADGASALERTVDARLEAERAERARTVREDVAGQIVDRARNDLLGALVDGGYGELIAAMQTALSSVLDGARDAADDLGDADPDDARAILKAGKRAIDAHARLVELADCYGLVRQAQEASTRFARERLEDVDNDFAELSTGWSELWPGKDLVDGGPAPWGDGDLARLVWLSRLPEGTCHLPDVAERNRLYREHREALDEAKAQRKSRRFATSGA